MTTSPPTSPEPAHDGVLARVREGADLYNAGRFWHAHEAWETAWNDLKAQGRVADAEFVQGLILVTAAFENRARRKEAGFKRQMASGLHKLRANAAAAPRLGFSRAPTWTDALTDLYLEACMELRWERWRATDAPAPRLGLD